MAAAITNPGLPRILYAEVTNRCNLKCKACVLYRGSWESPRDMTLDELIRITDQLPELERIALHGIGEPLLNKDLAAMIRHLKNRDVSVFFNSNGILLDEIRQKELIDTGLDELRISLDAATAGGYKIMRNSHQFDRIVKNLRTFVERTGRSALSHPKLSLWFLGTRENIAELPEFIRLAAAVGIGEVYFQRLVYFQDGDSYGLAAPEKTLMDADANTREFVKQSQFLAKELKVQFNASGLTTPLASVQTDSEDRCPWKRCLRPTTLMYVTANGNVLPCCISPFATTNYGSIVLGNVFENNLKEIWHGTKYRQFRKSHQTDTPPRCCRGCGIRWSL